MANPFGIPEVTMADLVDSGNAVNRTSNTNVGRKAVYQPYVVIVSDHAYTTSNLDTDWPDGSGTDADFAGMEDHLVSHVAVFQSKSQGSPWVLGGNKDAAKNHVISNGDATKLDATVVYPDFDYSNYE